MAVESTPSHVSLIVNEANRCVSISYSDPGGLAWVGEEGFDVHVVDFREMTSSQDVVVDEGGVIAAVLERLRAS